MADWHFGSGGQNPRSPRGAGGGVERVAAWVICLAAAAVGLWLLIRYAWGAFLPFLLAYLLGRCIRPLVTRAVGKSKLPRGVVAAVLVLLMVGVLALLISWAVGRALAELEALLADQGAVGGGWGAALSEVADWFRSISQHLPFLQKFRHSPGFDDFCRRLDVMTREAAEQALTAMGARISGIVVGAVARLPSAILFVTVLLLSCYYVAAGDGSVERALGRRLISRLPSAWRQRLPAFRARGKKMAVGYLRAYAILAGVTLVEMFIGLSILRIPYALIGAVAIALVDILPVLGAGTVLIPWAVVQFILGETGMGIGLLVLWGVSALLRQVLEPRLVSVTLGIHPLLSLMAMYAGLRLFGIWGMLLCPLGVTAYKTVMSSSEREVHKTSES